MNTSFIKFTFSRVWLSRPLPRHPRPWSCRNLFTTQKITNTIMFFFETMRKLTLYRYAWHSSQFQKSSFLYSFTYIMQSRMHPWFTCYWYLLFIHWEKEHVSLNLSDLLTCKISYHFKVSLVHEKNFLSLASLSPKSRLHWCTSPFLPRI